jgi:hypothetical protein
LSWYQHRGRSSGPYRDLRPARHARIAARRVGSRLFALIVPMLVALPMTGLMTGTGAAAERSLWGYGVRSCEAYMGAVAEADAGNAAELQRYEDWLAGFVSALNLALGEDVLRGSGLSAAIRATRDYCADEREQDFFNAAMDHVRGLSSLR